MSRTLASKFKFVVVVLAVLAMMIPAAIPVSAAFPVVNMYLVNPITGETSEVDGGYNAIGSDVYLTSSIEADWSIDFSPGGGATYGNDTGTTFEVEDGFGEVNIIAQDVATENETSINKKWDTIDYTEFSPLSGSSLLSFNQTAYYYGTGSITDTVIGDEYGEPLQGVILNWYLIEGNVAIDPTPGEAKDLKARMAGYQVAGAAKKVQFIDGSVDPSDPSTWLGTSLTRQNAVAKGVDIVTDIDGQVTVNFAAWGDASVQIVVVPEYPNNPQLPLITPEITTWQFVSYEDAIVPQVRWVGEKIVLEKYFLEEDLWGDYVQFTIEEGQGTLEQIGIFEGPAGFNWTSNGKSVWTEIGEGGVANVILTSSTANEVVVSMAVYDQETIEEVFAQDAFITYFLKLESVRLSDVPGKRDGHYTGVWEDEANPYNQSFPYWASFDEVEDYLYEEYLGRGGEALENANPDVYEQDRNISQDALERVQVKGYFMGNHQSSHEAALADFNGDGINETTLPQYRWILPDDWADLAPAPMDENYKFWDIMSAPNSGVTSEYEIGPYEDSEGNPASGSPVIGPFTPGIEVMLNTGWGLANNGSDSEREYTTVVIDGDVNAWDAPMPPAKVDIFINEGNGYFKWTDKGDVYQNTAGEYTNPFYFIMVPAHWAIPAFNSTANYKWDSFGGTDEEYPFWQFIDYSGEDVGYPTHVQVYSDNHGEAMAWLNGDYNVDFTELWSDKGGVSAKDGMEVDMTEVQAMASYPYLPVDKSFMSNTVEKTWYWNGMILGIDAEDYGAHAYYDNVTSGSTVNILAAGDYDVRVGDPGWNPDGDLETDDAVSTSDDLMVFVWARDRDGLAAGMIGARLDISGISEGAVIKQMPNAHMVSDYNEVTRNITVAANGFLAGTQGVRLSDTTGYCFFRLPNDAEKALFVKNIETFEDAYGMDAEHGQLLSADDFVVAGFDLYYSGVTDIHSTVDIVISSPDFGVNAQSSGQLIYTINADWGMTYPVDDPIVAGDANHDGEVDALDIAVIENMIMEIEESNINGDATSNGQINMGDVVKVIRMIRNLD